jgi:hypothetical protein
MLTEAQERPRAQLAARFAQSDSRVGAPRSTLSFLQNQIGAWNARDKRHARPVPREACRRVDSDARVAGADSSQLVALCYERLTTALGTALFAAQHGDDRLRSQSLTRARSTFTALQLGITDGSRVAGALRQLCESARRPCSTVSWPSMPKRLPRCAGTSARWRRPCCGAARRNESNSELRKAHDCWAWRPRGPEFVENGDDVMPPIPLHPA